jgi:hypothetical protein
MRPTLSRARLAGIPASPPRQVIHRQQPLLSEPSNGSVGWQADIQSSAICAKSGHPAHARRM